MREAGASAVVAQSLLVKPGPAPRDKPHDAVIAIRPRHPSAGRNVPAAQNGRCGTGNFTWGGRYPLCERAKFRVAHGLVDSCRRAAINEPKCSSPDGDGAKRPI
ncbi:Uncharacterised protein [Salmonella enterica subsp. enterica]|uniref:Uncharacterized protein n=1 Tax=Salmonella enterica I TaxID=59201 RepID=A0A379WZI6_SALET|nr:Uncharacterised protein [Salmonella enterica subsp. enterica]